MSEPRGAAKQETQQLLFGAAQHHPAIVLERWAKVTQELFAGLSLVNDSFTWRFSSHIVAVAFKLYKSSLSNSISDTYRNGKSKTIAKVVFQLHSMFGSVRSVFHSCHDKTFCVFQSFCQFSCLSVASGFVSGFGKAGCRRFHGPWSSFATSRFLVPSTCFRSRPCVLLASLRPSDGLL